MPRLGESSLPREATIRPFPRIEREDLSQAAAHPSRTPSELGRGRRKLQRGAWLRQQLRQLPGVPRLPTALPGPALTWVEQQYSVRPSSYAI